MAAVSSDTRSVNRSTQRRPMPVCPAERSGQPGEKRRVAIGLIVVKSVAKSLLILINRGDMGKSTMAI